MQTKLLTRFRRRGPKVIDMHQNPQGRESVRSTEEMKQRRLLEMAVVLLIVVGVLLRLAQYVAGTSLWGDELSVVRNITSKDLATLLTKPLSDDQVAPPGFLILLKLIVTLMGTSEYSLRLISLLPSLLALPLFASFARKFLSREALLFAVAAFSLCLPLIRYAGQVKPYSLDVLASLLCLLAAHSWMESSSLRVSLRAAAIGAIAVWFSYPSVFTLAAIAMMILWHFRTRRSLANLKHVAGIFAVWLISSTTLLTFEHRRVTPGLRSYMQTFWADWMLPAEFSWARLGAWIVRVTQDFLSDFLHLPKWPLLCLLLLVGTIFVFRSQASLGILLLAPILVTFMASMARSYPFRGRVVLFLVPNVLLLLTFGLLAVTRATARLRPSLWGQYAIFLIAIVVLGMRPLWKNPPPYRDSETKPILSYLGERRRDGDSIYVLRMAWHAFEFYGPRFSLSMNQAKIGSLQGSTRLGPNPLPILKDLDEFRGNRRLWVVFGGGYGEESEAAIGYLDTIGQRLDCKSSYNAAVYLYDLGDSYRLGSTQAEDFLSSTPHTRACERY